jgi:Integrase core domain
MQPSRVDGAQHIVIAIDPFSKWIEGGVVPNLKADTITTWFHDNVVCRYGVPQWVRTDRGSEFKADFEAYCASSGIIIRKISANNPRANG